MIEHICVDLLLPETKSKLRFLCVYCPPDLSRQVAFVNTLTECISTLEHNFECFYLIGDLNMPYIDWESLTSTKQAGDIFTDYCAKMDLCQYICESTSKHDSVLDLLLCDELSYRHISSIEVLPPLSTTCDHNVIQFTMQLQRVSDSCAKIPSFFNYKYGDYDKISTELSQIDWNRLFRHYNYDIQKIYDHFLEKNSYPNATPHTYFKI